MSAPQRRRFLPAEDIVRPKRKGCLGPAVVLVATALVGLTNVAQPDAVPGSGTCRGVSDPGAATGPVAATGSEVPRPVSPTGGGSSLWAGRGARPPSVRLPARPDTPPTDGSI